MASQPIRAYTSAPQALDGLDDLDHDSNDDNFDGDFDDDDNSLDDMYDDRDSAEFDADNSRPLCIICRKKPAYSDGEKAFPTCGYRCGRMLQNAITLTDPNPNDTTPVGNGVNHNNNTGNRDGFGVPGRSTSDRGPSGYQPRRTQNTPQPSSTTYVDPNIHRLTQHLGGYKPQRNQGRPQGQNVVVNSNDPLVESPVEQYSPTTSTAPRRDRRPNLRQNYTMPQPQTQSQPQPQIPQSFRRRTQLQQEEEDDMPYATTHGGQRYWAGPPPSQATSSTGTVATVGQNQGGYNRRNNYSTGSNTRRPQNYQLPQPQGSPSFHLATRHIQPQQPRGPPHPAVACVVCRVKTCRDSRYVTCGLTCAEKLCTTGSSDPSMCDYCHRRPKQAGHRQCGANCRDSAKIACLLCKSRPKFGRYHLCGKSCKQIATKQTPLILEAPPGHATFELVEKKFKAGWKVTSPPCPQIKKIYKIIENKAFLQPYDRYKKTVGNEVFTYHGTSRKCTLGTGSNNQLCNATNCSLCNILKTSFKTELANPSGAFGPGIYTSSASNKAYSYTSGGTGAIILTKVILGKPRPVNGWNEVMTCPAGFNSVVFDRNNGTLNETIVYSNDAIRPVFLVVF